MSIATMIGGMGFVGAASADVIVGNPLQLNPSSQWLGATTATNLVVNAGGIGHQLITPYFNAQKGNATIISVTNSDTVNGKVMKVRFRGASNSDDILDFTVLMSPGDVWNATVTSPTETAPAQIVTQDKTCTLPQFAPGQPEPFKTQRLTSKSNNDVNNHTREGYIEIFNMADIPSSSQYGPGNNAVSALFTTIKHVNGTPPCVFEGNLKPTLVSTNWTVEGDAASRGLASPTTGLFGNWVIINVPQTTTYSGEMVAIRAVDNAGVDARANYIVFPQEDRNYDGTIDWVTADPLLRTQAWPTMNSAGGGLGAAVAGPVIQPLMFDLPDMSTPYVTAGGNAVAPLTQAAAVTAALAARAIVNEYATDPIIAAKTDWVFSMPTRRYTVAMDYAPATSRKLYSQVLDAVALAPYFHDGNTSINALNAQQLCVSATSQIFYDREEGTRSSGAVFSPGNATRTQFCGETSVLSFAAGSGESVLAGSVARQDTGSSGFINGWGFVNVRNSANGLGLPILGGSFIKAVNPNVAAGQSGTYGITSEHRSIR